MHDPERIQQEKATEDNVIDKEQVRQEIRAMLDMVFGGSKKRLRGVRPGDLTVRYESVHDDE